MVWVSNYASQTIKVQITNKTGGSASTFTIYPKQNETWEINHWSRGGKETATIKWEQSGKTQTYEIDGNVSPVLRVYDDAVVISQGGEAHRVS